MGRKKSSSLGVDGGKSRQKRCPAAILYTWSDTSEDGVSSSVRWRDSTGNGNASLLLEHYSPHTQVEETE